MTVRTTKSNVTFLKPFVLGGFDELLPSGTYQVETDEELLENLSFQAYRRVRVLIHLPAKSGRPGFSRTLTIDPNELDAALKRDAASYTGIFEQSSVRDLLCEAPTTRKAEADCRAVDRAEDEGMTLHPR